MSTSRLPYRSGSAPRARHLPRHYQSAWHPEFDGSESLRGPDSTAVISGVGDVFVMKMTLYLGDYEMNNHVAEYRDGRIGWEPEAGRGHPDAAPDSP